MTEAEVAHTQHGDGVTVLPTFGSETSQTRKRSKKSGLKMMFISGVGFLADAYDLFVIDFVVAILSSTASVEPKSGERGLVTAAALAGAVIGQLGFGFAADFIGRRLMFISTAVLCVFGNIASALVGFGYRSHASSFSVFYQLAIVRFLLGIGIGGEYPLAATVASESDDSDENDAPPTGCCWYLQRKPNSVACVFSMQGLGMLLSPLFVMLLISTGVSLEATWRLCLGVGAIPSAIAFFFRWRMSESSSFKDSKRNLSLVNSDASTTVLDSQSSVSTASVVNSSPANVERSGQVVAEKQWKQPTTKKPKCSEKSQSVKPAKQKLTCSKFGKHLKHIWQTLKQFRWVLIGTSLTWFLIDITFYGTGSFKSAVVGEMFETDVARLRRLEYQSVDFQNEGLYRELEFPMSVRQMQRDNIRAILRSFAEGEAFPVTDVNVTVPASGVAATIRSLATDDVKTRDRIFREALMSTFVALLAIPGYILSVFFIHKTGLRPLTLYGFWAVAVVFFVLGGELFLQLNIRPVELILFGLTFLFTNFGPNTSTFILPTTVYPTVVRATCHGFSAAMGKLGGAVGITLFEVIKLNLGLAWLQIFCGIVAVLGAIITIFFIPTDEDAKVAMMHHEIQLSKRANKCLEARQIESPGRSISINHDRH